MLNVSSRVLGGIVAVAGLTIVVGCSKKPQDAFRREAGVGQQAMGIIVRQATSDQIQLLSSKDGVTLRSLYGGDVEVSGLKEEEVRGLLPEASLKKNVYFSHLLPVPSRKPDLSKLDLVGGGNPFDVRDCKKLPNPPITKVAALTLGQKLKAGGVLERKDGTLRLTSEDSTPGIPTTKPLDVLWAVFGPEGSKYEHHVVPLKVLEITPDELGGYQVFLVIKDERDACSMSKLSFAVTHNEPYVGPISPRVTTEEELKLFSHLDVVGAPEAWKVTKGKGVKIAILDSGVNYNHPDLRPNIAINQKEIAGNGLDDDNNGLVDDVYGYDFNRNDNMPFDDNRHGTHVAGLAASAVSGVAPEAEILPIKISDPHGGGDLASIEAGIRYAVDQGAQIINMSFGGEARGVPESLAAAMAYAEDRGVLVVVAAGNGDPKTGMGFDIDQRPVMPAAMTNRNILAVAATRLTGGLTNYSNFGIRNVDVAAPGGDREGGLLFAPGFNFEKNMYIGLAGTSMATPVTSGVAALVLAANPTFSAAEIKVRIMTTIETSDLLKEKVMAGGQVSASRAVSPPTPELLAELQ